MTDQETSYTRPASFGAGLALVSALLLSRFGPGDPFRWVGLLWTCAFALAAVFLRGRARSAAAGMTALSAVLLLFEIGLGGGFSLFGVPSFLGKQYNTRNSTYHGGDLGYGPLKNARIASKQIAGGRVVYDVVYSIDENGFRKTPALAAGSPAVLFLGDSFTFGEGVNDDEAFPAVFQSASGLKAINLAYRGDGPHQMLRLLETEREIPAAAGYRPFMAFYLFIPAHVDRAAGKELWNSDGPHYEVDSSGALRYLGPWHGFLVAGAVRALSQSAVVRWCWLHWPRTSPRDDTEDVERFAAIVAELRRVFRQRYHGDFTVLLWDGDESGTLRIKERLLSLGVASVMLADVVPDIKRRELYYFDGHPGATLDREVGLYLARLAAKRG